jgi:cephalosporin-C deacetylase-like acetyl esterase
VAGGIDDRVTVIASGVPAICDHGGRETGQINGWPKIVPYDANGVANAKALQASRYIDAVNFASRFQGKAIMSVGFVDRTCPPSSCYAAFNVLDVKPGDKTMLNEPLMGHAAPAHIKDAFFEFIKRSLK